jgi:peroxiredoxin Q/BCP
MAQLRQDFDKFRQRNTVVIAIGPEPAEGFRAFFRENALPFIGLPDPSHDLLDLYGQQFNLLKLGRMPAQVLVDPDGVARSAYYGSSMRDIPPNKYYLDLIDALNAKTARRA